MGKRQPRYVSSPLCALPLLLHLLQQCGVVLANAHRMGMRGAEHALTDRQRSLEERLGLLILALIRVEQRQVVEVSGQLGMFWA